MPRHCEENERGGSLQLLDALDKATVRRARRTGELRYRKGASAEDDVHSVLQNLEVCTLVVKRDSSGRGDVDGAVAKHVPPRRQVRRVHADLCLF